jgi:hypothetical protein
MKTVLLILSFLCLSLAGFSQTTPPSQDTTKIWTIHGQNTFLINQASFNHWAAGGTNAVAANLVLDYDFNYKKDKWSWDNKAIVGYGLSKQNGTGWRKTTTVLSLTA